METILKHNDVNNPDSDENEENDPNDDEIEDDNTNPSGENDNIEEVDILDEYDEAHYNYDNLRPLHTTQSGRTSRAPELFSNYGKQQKQQHFIFTQGHKETLYSIESAQIIAKTMHYLNNMIHSKKYEKLYSFVVTYSLNKCLKHFGQKGYDAAFGEVKQLHDRVVFRPVNISDLTPQERKRALESLIFLAEKRDGRVKGRACTNGALQSDYIPKEDAASPTISTESILLTGTIEAKERRDILTSDVPHAFVQTDMEKIDNEKVIMKIRGPLVEMLISLDPELY